ncbi:MAG: methanol dehydrogenase [Methylophaga sp.]|nr:MAG: methanol dehydrogenase [Methylophaga sp.]
MNKLTILSTAAAVMLAFGATAIAYDGTKCSEPGICWEAKPGFPDKIKGSKFDPKHSQTELNKQDISMKAVDARNAKRAANFKKTGKWVF